MEISPLLLAPSAAGQWRMLGSLASGSNPRYLGRWVEPKWALGQAGLGKTAPVCRPDLEVLGDLGSSLGASSTASVSLDKPLHPSEHVSMSG